MIIEEVLTEFKRTHLEHIEDIVITDGYEGGKAVVEYFRGLLLTLKGTSSEAMSVSVKWDGAPPWCVASIRTTVSSLLELNQYSQRRPR